ncbi:hypothetical protein SeMB42_g01231 [Synchytrium endobioticum]|uniref:RNA helicase n=1 Tax=Synchytrium endobioticum TaxID=286115 RepID=A0A507DHN9_9FUNG|nr:hypothetical protein SeLEV6574_g00709 [Synchytrium endobioticum]TPX52696.1 hypothetical protein SeMB42_g01231 [Synchytrium endobioticum]
MDLDQLFGGFNDNPPGPPSDGASAQLRANGSSSTAPASQKKRHTDDINPSSKKIKPTSLQQSLPVTDPADPAHPVRALKVQPVVADEFAQEFSKEYALAETPAPDTTATTNTSNSKQPTTNGTSSLPPLDRQSPPPPTCQTLKISASVRHQVALPPDWPAYIPLHEHLNDPNPARTYPFQLDPFQQLSIKSIERNESVLVSAHTSAGKTVVAEYAIAHGLRNKTRVIYTSPIKALSNQKYRELYEAFGDVGLMTGDVTINPSASCIVMTTEILRSMLYRGSDISREVSWVVFDEIHYMRDKSRGVVWEETIIMLPDQVRFVFLSATIPNAMQFAQWICRIHKQPCHVVYTDYRPTPLQHYVFPEGSLGINLVVDEKGEFKEEVFQRAIASLSTDEEKRNTKRINKKNKKDLSTSGPTDLEKLIKMIVMKNFQPCIIFSFRKRECEANALVLGKHDFNTEAEKEAIKTIFSSAIQGLSEADRSLPAIEHLEPLLLRGIGIHHSGLLPILKEVIEILFQEGFIKVLFATETFSIGLNMPAKTVVFTETRKWDGTERRHITGGEYIQMSGRAGRRGIDDRGIVILMLDEKMPPEVAKSMLKGQSDRLNSAFHLGYSMILNLTRVEGVAPEFLLERSFLQFQSQASLPQLEDDLTIFEQRRDRLEIPNENEVARYHDITTQLTHLKRDERDVIAHPSYILPFIQAGRLVRIRLPAPSPTTTNTAPQKDDDKFLLNHLETSNQAEETDFGWGIIINYSRRVPAVRGGDLSAMTEGPTYIVDVLLECATGTESYNRKPNPPVPGQKGEFVVVPCVLSCIDGLSQIKLTTLGDVKADEGRASLGATIRKVEARYAASGIPILHPVDDMNIKDDGFIKLEADIAKLETSLKEHPLQSNPLLNEWLDLYATKLKINAKIKSMKRNINDAQSIIQLDELKRRRRVLRRLGYLSSSDVVQLKGRVACDITTGDELVLTELMFNNVFMDLEVCQMVALCSCLINDSEADDDASAAVNSELQSPLRLLCETARRIARVSIECKIIVDEELYVKSFSPSLMAAVYAWAKGASFKEMMKVTDDWEGNVIRVIRRLNELLVQLADAAKGMGNDGLAEKFREGSKAIKRDIVFAASLYL